MLIYKGIVQHYLFAVAEAGKKCVGFCRAFGAIYDIYIGKRKIDLSGVGLNLLPEAAFGQWCKLIEYRNDPGGIKHIQQHHQHYCHYPGIYPEIIAKRKYQPQYEIAKCAADNNG